jgi:hypothetical protein
MSKFADNITNKIEITMRVICSLKFSIFSFTLKFIVLKIIPVITTVSRPDSAANASEQI